MRTKEEMLGLRTKDIEEAYARIRQDLEYLVMATPTGKAREDLTSARIFVERAKQRWARSNA